MSAYLTNLLSRSLGNTAVQPRLSPLFGPATRGPEWTLTGPRQTDGDEEAVVALRPGPTPAPELASLEIPASAVRDAGVTRRHESSAAVPQVEPGVLPVQASAPEDPSVGPALRLTAERSQRAMAAEPSADAPLRPDFEVPVTGGLSVGGEIESRARVRAPAKPETISLPVQAKRVVRATPAEVKGDLRPLAQTRSAAAREDGDDGVVAAPPAERPNQDSGIPISLATPQQAAIDRRRQSPGEHLPTLVPESGKPVARRTLETAVPALPVRPRRPDHANVAQPPAPAEPTITVTIGRIEVRAVAPPQPVKSPPPVAPVMSLDEYLRRRSGRS
jgi:hypothetical protein